MGLPQWFSNDHLCSICRLCSLDNQFFVMCFAWFPSNLDAHRFWGLYFTSCRNCSCSNSSRDWCGLSNGIDSIRRRVFN